MPIANLQLPIEKKPFEAGEKRTLAIRVERIDPKHLIDGEPPSVEAEYGRTEKHPTHQARYFQLSIVNRQSVISVQLNHGDPAADEDRLTAIAEDLLQAPGTRDQAIGESIEPLVPGAKCLVPEGGEA